MVKHISSMYVISILLVVLLLDAIFRAIFLSSRKKKKKIFPYLDPCSLNCFSSVRKFTYHFFILFINRRFWKTLMRTFFSRKWPLKSYFLLQIHIITFFISIDESVEHWNDLFYHTMAANIFNNSEGNSLLST